MQDMARLEFSSLPSSPVRFACSCSCGRQVRSSECLLCQPHLDVSAQCALRSGLFPPSNDDESFFTPVTQPMVGERQVLSAHSTPSGNVAFGRAGEWTQGMGDCLYGIQTTANHILNAAHIHLKARLLPFVLLGSDVGFK